MHGIESVVVGKNRFAFRRTGSGPVLLLVHGWPLHGGTWDGVLPELSRHFTCVAPDLPGLGLTNWADDHDFSFRSQARALRGFVDAVGLDDYAILAQDTGATIARLLASEDERAGRLVCLNTEIPGHRPPFIRFFQTISQIPLSGSSFGLLLRSRLYLRSPMGFGGCFHDLDRLDTSFLERFVTPLLRDSRRMDGLFRYLRGIDWAVVDALPEIHARIRGPIRFAWGLDDPTFPAPLARAVVPQCAEGSDFVGIERAKLLVHEERPDDVTRATVEFLEADSRRAGAGGLVG